MLASRVDGGGEPLAPVELAEVVEDVRTDLAVRLEESGAELTVGPLPRVEGDADQLRALCQNLLENAIQYCGDAPPVVDVTAEREGASVVVSVADEGIGIDPAHHEAIFDVFNRLHSRAEHPGTGIGLSLCERIVERHGGELWVDSAPGEGATFSFSLPVAEE